MEHIGGSPERAPAPKQNVDRKIKHSRIEAATATDWVVKFIKCDLCNISSEAFSSVRGRGGR